MEHVVARNKSDLAAVGLAGLREVRRGDVPVAHYLIRLGSGTTKTPPAPIIRHVEWPPEFREEPLHFFDNGKRSLIAFSTSGILSFLLGAWKSAQSDETELMLLHPHDLPNVEWIAREFEPDVLSGFKNLVLSAAVRIEDSALRGRITVIDTAGEVMTADEEAVLAKRMPNATRRATLALSEAGVVGLSCPFLARNQYHPTKGTHIHIHSASDADEGELTITKEVSPFLKFVQYPSGDSAKKLAPCPCGKEVAFEVLGRLGLDFLPVAGALLHHTELDRVAGLIEPRLEDFEILVQEIGTPGEVRGKLTVAVECVDTPTPQQLEAIKKIFVNNLYLTPTRTLAQLERDELFLPTDIKVNPTLSRRAKKTRIRKI